MPLENRLRAVFAAVFGVAPDAVSAATSPASLPQWDSVSHIQLFLAVEAEFGTEFDPDEIAGLATFDAIRRRLAGTAVGRAAGGAP